MVFHCVNEPHFLFPFFCCGKSGLFPASGYHKQGWYEHSGTGALWHGGTSFGYIPKSGITRSSGRSICNFLRHFQIAFQNDCTTLKSHWKGKSVPLSRHPHQHALSPKVLILTILIGVRWNLWVILICISLIIKDFEHFFRYFSTIQDSPVMNSRFSSIAHFFHWFVWDF